jgi:hypothetical protein
MEFRCRNAEPSEVIYREGMECKDEFVAQGVVSAKVTALMKVLAVRDLHPTKKQLARVAACTDAATLDPMPAALGRNG